MKPLQAIVATIGRVLVPSLAVYLLICIATCVLSGRYEPLPRCSGLVLFFAGFAICARAMKIRRELAAGMLLLSGALIVLVAMFLLVASTLPVLR